MNNKKLLISELVGQKGVYPFLNHVFEKSDIIKDSEVITILEGFNLNENILLDLIRCGLLIRRTDGLYISSSGKKTTLLLKAINEDMQITDVFQKLAHLYPTLIPYELITESVTDYFIESVYSKPYFIRLYICSPWIRLNKDQLRKIKSAISHASTIYSSLQIYVITLPPNRYRDKNALDTIRVLKNIGAEIVVNSKLHAKLYISEPGPEGGAYYSILGSENLTGRGNIELALKIENDNEILRKLNNYFRNIFFDSKLLREI